MREIPKEVFDYLRTQRIGVLAVEMSDGSPHAATVHFAHSEDPFVFYFETYREYKKAEALFGRPTSRASLVVGTDEKISRTLQLDGVVELIKPEERNTYDSVYFGKFPEKIEKSKDQKFVFFKFTPTWWRFTDWHTSEGKKIWVSNQ